MKKSIPQTASSAEIPMPIESDRLLIQPRCLEEASELNQVIHESFDSLREWMPWCQTRPSLEESKEHCQRALQDYLKKKDIVLSIYEKSSGELIGSSGLHRINWSLPSFEIGYWLKSSCRGNGFITESTKAICNYAFDTLKAVRVEIRCDEKNLKSLAVMKRLDFEVEGVLKNQERSPQGELRNTVVSARTERISN